MGFGVILWFLGGVDLVGGREVFLEKRLRFEVGRYVCILGEFVLVFTKVVFLFNGVFIFSWFFCLI